MFSVFASCAGKKRWAVAVVLQCCGAAGMPAEWGVAEVRKETVTLEV